jgi:undecaprenyl-diphosphatase
MLHATDTELFLWLNGDGGYTIDNAMNWLSSRWSATPIYAGLLYLLFLKYKKGLIKILPAVALMILVSDQVSVAVKNLVQRERPCHEATLAGQVHQVEHKCGGAFGFYSSHASNTMSLAVFCSMLLAYRFTLTGLMLWVLAVGYSRIYLGVHYPGDILAGWIAGASIGWVAAKLLIPFLNPTTQSEANE